MKLTAAQIRRRAFAEHVASGKSATEAYKLAGYKSVGHAGEAAVETIARLILREIGPDVGWTDEDEWGDCPCPDAARAILAAIRRGDVKLPEDTPQIKYWKDNAAYHKRTENEQGAELAALRSRVAELEKRIAAAQMATDDMHVGMTIMDECDKALAELIAARSELFISREAAGCVTLNGDVITDTGVSVVQCISSLKAELAAERELREKTEHRIVLFKNECIGVHKERDAANQSAREARAEAAQWKERADKAEAEIIGLIAYRDGDPQGVVQSLARASVVIRIRHIESERDAARAEAAALRQPEIIGRIRSVAYAHGWAIGVHGSLRRDIDLIGVPWTAEACDPDALARAIAVGIGYISHGHNLSARRPGGRRSILLMHPDATYTKTEKGTWTPPAIDLSLMWDYGPEADKLRAEVAVMKARKVKVKLPPRFNIRASGRIEEFGLLRANDVEIVLRAAGVEVES
jgi:hypothetical protein